MISLNSMGRRALRLALGLWLACAMPAMAETFAIPGAGVSFEAPEGFTVLSKQEILMKYPAARAPAFVVGNARRSTTIAYDLKPDAIPADRLGEVKTAFEGIFERVIPGIDWKERKLIEMQGQQWILLELSSRAIDTDIHNIMLVTPWQGKMLIFNFNSTREEFPRMEAVLRKSQETIVLSRP